MLKVDLLDMLEKASKVKVKFFLRLKTLHSKVDMLINYWDKIVTQVLLEASRKGDLKMKNIINLIMLVPAEVRKACLRQYIAQCRKVHSIAFLQWRVMHPVPSEYHNIDKLKEMIQ